MNSSTWCLTYNKPYRGLTIKVFFFLTLLCFWYIYKKGCWPVCSDMKLTSDIKALRHGVLADQGWAANPADTSPAQGPPQLTLLRAVARALSLVAFSISVAEVCASAVRVLSISSRSMEGLQNLPDYPRGCVRRRWWFQSLSNVQEVEHDAVAVLFYSWQSGRKRTIIVFING